MSNKPPMTPRETVTPSQAASNINARAEALRNPATIKAVDQADKKVTPSTSRHC